MSTISHSRDDPDPVRLSANSAGRAGCNFARRDAIRYWAFFSFLVALLIGCTNTGRLGSAPEMDASAREAVLAYEPAGDEAGLFFAFVDTSGMMKGPTGKWISVNGQRLTHMGTGAATFTRIVPGRHRLAVHGLGYDDFLVQEGTVQYLVAYYSQPGSLATAQVRFEIVPPDRGRKIVQESVLRQTKKRIISTTTDQPGLHEEQ